MGEVPDDDANVVPPNPVDDKAEFAPANAAFVAAIGEPKHVPNLAQSLLTDDEPLPEVDDFISTTRQIATTTIRVVYFIENKNLRRGA